MKPNTYTKLYVHCVFTPKGRTSLLTDSIRDRVHRYIYGTVKEKKCYPVVINGTKDHVHILLGFGPTVCISDLIRPMTALSLSTFSLICFTSIAILNSPLVLGYQFAHACLL